VDKLKSPERPARDNIRFGNGPSGGLNFILAQNLQNTATGATFMESSKDKLNSSVKDEGWG
jgi:hypothetical protein